MESTFISDQRSSSPEEAIISYQNFSSPSPPIPFNVKKTQNAITVIFRKVEETYAVGCDVEVFYTVLGGLEVTSRDWIGLYKVGWRSHQDYVYYDWSPFHEAGEEEVEKKVVFSGAKMPKEDGDFYQFCYVTSSGQTKGASTPFQFKAVDADDFVVEEECGEGGLMVVKTKKQLLQDQVLQTKLENLSINKRVLSLEEECEGMRVREKEMKECMEKMQKEEEVLKKQSEERMEQLTEARQQNDYLQTCLNGMQEKMDVLNQEKTSMERRLDDSDGYISSLQDKIKNLVLEKDVLQGKVNAQGEENAAMKNLSRQLMLECEEKVRKLKAREVDASVQMGKTLDDLTNLKTSMAYLSDRLQNCEDKLGAAEHCKKMLNEEVVALKATLEGMEAVVEEERRKKQLEVAAKEKQIEERDVEVRERDRQLEAINEQLREYDMKLAGSLVEKVKCQLQGLKAQLLEKEGQVEELERQLQQSHGCMFALETAHEDLLRRLNRKKKKEEDQRRQLKVSSETTPALSPTASSVSSFTDLINLGQITSVQQASNTFQHKEDFIDTSPTLITEEERFMDALNDYSVVASGEHEGVEVEVLQGRQDVPVDAKSIRSCPFCPLVFDDGLSEVHMTNHVEGHMVDDRLSCPVCQLVLPDKSQLIVHTETHFFE